MLKYCQCCFGRKIINNIAMMKSIDCTACNATGFIEDKPPITEESIEIIETKPETIPLIKDKSKYDKKIKK